MKYKNKKGFTLVELLAVIVVIAVILIIAVNVVTDRMKEADIESLKIDANSFIKEVNGMASLSIKSDVKYEQGLYDVADLIDNQDISITGKKPTSGYVTIVDYEVVDACLVIDGYGISFKDKVAHSVSTDNKCIPKYDYVFLSTDFNYKTSVQEYIVPQTGKYKIELWGAAGGLSDTLAGRGAYTSGIINLTEGTHLYFYTGEQATNGIAATFNGGGGCSANCSPGGGATDVRLIGGNWDSIPSLASRIMVAAGGAGINIYRDGYYGAPGGTLTGTSGDGDSPGSGGTQTSGGISNGNIENRNGKFGIGGFGDNWGGGGSGGYYGGSGGKNSGTGNGGNSGSSFISGYVGCVAIDQNELPNIVPKSGCSDGTTDVECSKYNSTYYFVNGVMLAGNEQMPDYETEGKITGNLNNGHARISLVG